MISDIRLPDSLGCTVASTAVILSLVKSELFKTINVFTKFPSLICNFKNIEIVDASITEADSYHVDLRTYTARRPHNSQPYRPSYVHMIEMAMDQLKHDLSIVKPNIILTEDDEFFARNEISRFKKPLIWLQTKSTTENRNWSDKCWHELYSIFSDHFDFLDLSNSKYSLRQSLAITKFSFAGICPDSFLVHGSAAVGAKNVIVLLGSSRKECVTYPGQVVLYNKSKCVAQPCGMHGYYRGSNRAHDALFRSKNCIHSTHLCMDTLSVAEVSRHINSLT
ncbi:hypothetical protein BIY29_04585 [Brenneria alni]|uniref:Uncharacterized protein n=2 Tax=Brenneria alni TaxID=71656 RepID=A0A421DRN6_9GAMM|nr:hypothetical protein BIY29_04585 [Brenneria alni]